LGNPYEFAKRYYAQGIDEILYIDIVASLYERNSLLELIEQTTQDIFVPITVGGGLRSIHDVAAALRAGADKVAINTAAIKNPEIISQIAQRFGSQCMVLSIQAKRNGEHWEAYYDCGREHSGLDAVQWAQRGEALGAGEILLTSVDKEGTGKGFDVELIKAVTDKVTIPVVASGGMGELQHFSAAAMRGHADAVAMAHVLHYNHLSVNEVRQYAISERIPVRRYEVKP
jgi:cyclase